MGPGKGGFMNKEVGGNEGVALLLSNFERETVLEDFLYV